MKKKKNVTVLMLLKILKLLSLKNWADYAFKGGENAFLLFCVIRMYFIMKLRDKFRKGVALFFFSFYEGIEVLFKLFFAAAFTLIWFLITCVLVIIFIPVLILRALVLFILYSPVYAFKLLVWVVRYSFILPLYFMYERVYCLAQQIFFRLVRFSFEIWWFFYARIRGLARHGAARYCGYLYFKIKLELYFLFFLSIFINLDEFLPFIVDRTPDNYKKAIQLFVVNKKTIRFGYLRRNGSDVVEEDFFCLPAQRIRYLDTKENKKFVTVYSEQESEYDFHSKNRKVMYQTSLFFTWFNRGGYVLSFAYLRGKKAYQILSLKRVGKKGGSLTD